MYQHPLIPVQVKLCFNVDSVTLFSISLHMNMNTCRYIVHAPAHARTHMYTHINVLFLSQFCFPEENNLCPFAFSSFIFYNSFKSLLFKLNTVSAKTRFCIKYLRECTTN
jgi:hypothetical protein